MKHSTIIAIDKIFAGLSLAGMAGSALLSVSGATHHWGTVIGFLFLYRFAKIALKQDRDSLKTKSL